MQILNYAVNYVDIALVAVFLISAYVGYRNGLFMSIINLIRYAVGFSLCFYCSDNFSTIVYDNYVRQIALDRINESLANSSVGDTLGGLTQMQSSFPAFLMGNQQEIAIPTTGDVANYILENVFESALITIIKILIFVLVYVLFFLSTGILIRIIKKSSNRRNKKRKEKNKRPTLASRTDKVLGSVFSIIKSLVLVLAISAVLHYLVGVVSPDSPLVSQIEDSNVLNFISSYNPFGYLIGG